MTHFDEIKRIEKAIENRDMAELRWAESFAKMRVDNAYQMHPKKIAKQAQKNWRKILEDVQTAIASLDTSLYDQWIVSLFNRDETNGDWRFEIDNEPIDIPEKLLPDFIIRLNSELPEIIERYTDWQLAMGLDYVYNPACSNCAFSIRNSATALSKRLAAIESIKNLYRDCFESRCKPALGHLSEHGNEFNGLCYMLWDITPLGRCDEDDPHRTAVFNAVTDVLDYALGMKNIACLESALHGLGHTVYYFPKAAEIIQAFIDKSSNLDPRILRYAEAAKTGCIQ